MAFATTRQLRDLTERVEELQKLVQSLIPTPNETYEVPLMPSVESDTIASSKDDHEEMVALLGKRYTALLEDAGYTSLEQLKNTPAGDLTAIVGIGQGVVKQISGGRK